MRFKTADQTPEKWHRVFAWLPVPLFGECDHGRRAWLEIVERRFPRGYYTNGAIPIFRPVGSHWDKADNLHRPPPPTGGGTGIRRKTGIEEGRTDA